MTHALYVGAAYAISALLLGAVAAWIVTDRNARKRELAELEARGIRRRSQASGAGD